MRDTKYESECRGVEKPPEIVISGLSGKFPESENLQEFQDNLYNGVDMITDDGRRWSPGLHGLPKRSGKLKELSKFDAEFFGVHPKQGHLMDPQLRILLELTHEALIDAGVNPSAVRGSNTGVFIGSSVSETETMWNHDIENANGYSLLGCQKGMLANRLSFAFDFQGPSFTIDTACSSSLLAMEQAVAAIKSGECDSAIVGGSHLCLNPEGSLQFHRLHMLSDEGKCRSFDSSGKGYVRSEAAVVIFLQKKNIAHRSYATVLNAKHSTDGYKEQGVTFPSGQRQAQLLTAVYREAGVDPTEVNYVEAHGTGTPAGDPQEVNAIAQVFCAEGRDPTRPLLLGSVKSNMGHSEPASGLCSVAKVLLSMQQGRIPANLHYKNPNPNIPALVDGRIKVVSENTPFPDHDAGGIVGINSFGFGGANVHVILKSNPNHKTPKALSYSLPLLVPFSGRNSESVEFAPVSLEKESKDTEKAKSLSRDELVYRHVILGEPSDLDTYSRRILPLVDKPVFPSRPAYGTTNGHSSSTSSAATRTGKQFRAFLQEVAAKSADAGADEFPILKAITENMCPGYGPLIPYQPQVTHDDTLLIVVFTNQHYDLIPSLEVLYRSAFPNILYCGHPHESVEIFLRKYQSVEHRSFSFLPTYTRATYECVLGAMEMNYEVKGYMVVTDETLMNTWNLPNLDQNKIWVSSSGYDKVTRGSWTKLDPGGQKLPRLLDGIVATWKLFSYILVGQDSYQFLEPRGIKRKRSLDSEDEKQQQQQPSESANVPVAGSSSSSSNSKSIVTESLETGESASAYIQGPNFKWDQKLNATGVNSEVLSSSDGKNLTREEKTGDLLPSDFDYLKSAMFSDSDSNNKGSSAENDTSTGSDDTTEEEVFVGEHDEDNRPLESLGLEETLEGSSSPAPDDKVTDSSGILIDPMLVTPTEESLENSTMLWPIPDINSKTEETDSFSSTTTNPESSVGVPLYHVEHIEPPTAPTWHKPEEVTSTTPITDKERNATPESNINHNNNNNNNNNNDKTISSVHSTSLDSDVASNTGKEINVPTVVPLLTSSSSSPSSTERGIDSETLSSTISSVILGDGSSSLSPAEIADLELKSDMETLLEVLHEVYVNMIALVGSYQENNEEVRNTEYSSEGMDASLLEDAKSHRISPREFRHIRCTLTDDGHQSELCSTLRSYINVLGLNLGRDIRLFHDTIPMYYLPAWATKPFYSVANVLLHYGVMDELALPLLFRGLALESDWVHLNKTDQTETHSHSTSSSSSTHHSSSTLDSESSAPLVSPSEAQYIHPFNLHKVYQVDSVRQSFCSNYLLRVLQM